MQTISCFYKIITKYLSNAQIRKFIMETVLHIVTWFRILSFSYHDCLDFEISSEILIVKLRRLMHLTEISKVIDWNIF